MALRRRFPLNTAPDDDGYQPGEVTQPESPVTAPTFHTPQPFAPTDVTTQPVKPPTRPVAPPPPPTYNTAGRAPVGRDGFDASAYRAANPDVDAELSRGAFGGDAWNHYREYGYRENRPGAASTTTTPGGTPPVDSSQWKTSGYAAPSFQPKAAGGAMPGWDQTKWANDSHQTPKYGVGRILSNFPPTVEGLSKAMSEIQRAYPGTTFDGKDKITIPGVGTIDVLTGASQGGTGWAWQDLPEAGVPPPYKAPAAPIPEPPSTRNSILELLDGEPLRTARFRKMEA